LCRQQVIHRPIQSTIRSDVQIMREVEYAAPPKINWMRKCGVPTRYEAFRLDTYQGNPKLVDMLKNHIYSKDSITMCGNTGCGKTHLAIGMLAEFLKQNTEAMFIPVPELLLRIRSSFGERSTQTEEELIEQYTAYALLVLDDLGAEKTTDYSITTLHLIIDRRYRYGRKTIVTTNFMDLETVEQTLGARIASRLSDSKIIKITSMPDWRKKRSVRGIAN